MRIENGIVIFGNPDRETIGQIRQVYERAERAVLCADSHVGYIMPIGGVAAYRDKVSVAGVGFDIACIAQGSLVTTADGYSLPIERVLPHHPISLWDGFNSRPASAHSGHVLTGRRPTLRLRLSNGRLLELTPDHQVLTLEGWKEAGQLGPEDRVACNPFVGMPYEEPSGSIPMPAEGRDLGLPHEAKDPRLAPLLRLMGFLCGDGHLSADGKRASWYAYHPHDAQSLQHDLARLGLQPRVHRRLRPNARREEFHVYVDSTTLHRALRGLGVPGGKKAWPADPMPWLFALPGWLRAQFLSGFCSADMSTPRVGKSGTIPNLQVKHVGHDDASSRFLARLLASLGFEASVVTTERFANGRSGYSTQVLGGQEAQLRFLETVGFCYSLERRAAAARVASIAWESQRLVRKREAARDQARSLKAQGVHWREITRQVSQAYGVPEEFVYHAIYGTRGKPRLSTTAKPQPNHSGEICWLSIESVEAGRETCVYDIATRDPAHCFYAQGVVVHNCGNAAIRTDLRLEQIQPHLEALADEIASTISFGIGRSNKSDDAPVNDPLFEDPAWEAIPGKGEREALREKARAQLGTVGSGNHYVDVFAEVSGPAGRGSDALDEQARVWVGVHFGSRGLGHTVASGFMALSQNRPWGSRGAEVEALLDLSSELGQAYWALMNLAGRYAYVGREWVARKVVQILGGRELELVHNHHNFAWKETHGGEEYVVVRKGATPAFPGQKGFVGGSMGDDAVILQGTPDPDPETRTLQEAALFSTVHGAGRVMSRRQALGKVDRKTGKILQPGQVTQGAMKKWLKQKGVTLRGGGLDESPHVYRRLPEVLEAQGKTVEVLHTLRPLIVVMAGANEFDPYKD
ncbi:RtcB family protein [Calidithermus chliarophilus]|uniref:RtcB family protein n=1 Tax=Calidithermus chliarophilus TaxID=52023 RepID=UPI000429CB9E|nr:RtcB family protein [Calidithermus chliarophilus]